MIGEAHLPARRGLVRFGGFVLVPMIGSLSPLLILPIIASQFGQAGWSAVAIGQSIGAAGAVIVELGWGLTGPQQVAAASAGERAALARIALLTKLFITLPVLPLSIFLAALVGPGAPEVKLLVCTATVIAGWSPSWYFLGSGHPTGILATETLPRLGSTVAAGVIMLEGGPLLVYPVLTIVANALSAILTTWFLTRRHRAAKLPLGQVFGSLKKQGTAVGARGLSAIYIAIPVTLVGIVSPMSVPAFAATDRLLRLGLLVLQSVPNSLQAWVGAAVAGTEKWRRIGVGVWICTGTGILALITFVTLGPYFLTLLFAGEVHVSDALMLTGGAVALVTMVNRGTGTLGLVRVNSVSWILASAVTATILGVPLILLLSPAFGAEGAMLGVLTAETAVMVLQAFGLLQKRRLEVEFENRSSVTLLRNGND